VPAHGAGNLPTSQTRDVGAPIFPGNEKSHRNGGLCVLSSRWRFDLYFQCSNLDGVIWQVFAKCFPGSFILGELVWAIGLGGAIRLGDTIDGMLTKRCSKSAALVLWLR
jgi:hypothetical protein